MLLNIGQIKKKRCYGCPYPITLFLLLPNEESNLAPQNQNLMYYRYTIRQSDLFLVSKVLNKVVSLDRNRLQKYCVFLIYQNFFDFFCIFLSFSIFFYRFTRFTRYPFLRKAVINPPSPPRYIQLIVRKLLPSFRYGSNRFAHCSLRLVHTV